MKKRRVLSLVVAAILLVSTLTVVGLLNVTAAEVSVATADALLEAIAADSAATIKLTDDVDMTGKGTIASFSGTIDGGDHTVTVNAPLFATLSGEVKNLTISGAITTDATGAVGALANTASGTVTVTNVTNGVAVTAANGVGVGGLIGEVKNSSTVTVTGAVNNGDVQGKKHVGGIIGLVGLYTNVSVHESVNSHSVLMADADSGVGGIIGSTDWQSGGDEQISITYCVNYGAVSSVAGEPSESSRGRAAGIIGRFSRYGKELVIDHCYNTGVITLNGSTNGDDSAAGIAAYVNKAYITNCYNIGDLSSTTNRYEIGRQRDNYADCCNNNFYIERDIGNTNIKASSCADRDTMNAYLRGIGYAVNKDGDAIHKWQCKHIAHACDGVCPYCGATFAESTFGDWEETKAPEYFAKGVETRACSVCESEETRDVAPSGLKNGAFEIGTEERLLEFAELVQNGTLGTDTNVRLTANVTLENGMTYINKSYSGTFDGAGYTISGMTQPLFEEIRNGTVKNLTLEGSIVTTEGYSGTVARKGRDFTLVNIQSSVSIIHTNGDNCIGGLIGYSNYGGKATDCAYRGTITYQDDTSANIGGIVGYVAANGGSYWFQGCVFDGSIVVTDNGEGIYVGGILGETKTDNSSGKYHIENAKVSGSITVNGATDSLFVGGIAGSLLPQDGDDRLSTVSGSVFNGRVSGVKADNIAAIAAKLTANTKLTECFCLSGEYPIVLDNAGEDNIGHCYAVGESGGEAFTLGDVTYRQYGFGYMNMDTLSFEKAGMTTEKLFEAYLSFRTNGTHHDAKLVFLTNLEELEAISTATVIFTFSKNESPVREWEFTLGGANNDFDVFQVARAAGEAYFASEGCALFGVVITDIPNGAWDAIEVRIVDNATDSELLHVGGSTSGESSSLLPEGERVTNASNNTYTAVLNDTEWNPESQDILTVRPDWKAVEAQACNYFRFGFTVNLPDTYRITVTPEEGGLPSTSVYTQGGITVTGEGNTYTGMGQVTVPNAAGRIYYVNICLDTAECPAVASFPLYVVEGKYDVPYFLVFQGDWTALEDESYFVKFIDLFYNVYPRLNARWGGTGAEPQTITLLGRLDYDGVAYATGSTVAYSIQYLNNGSDRIGSLAHELTHSVQKYHYAYEKPHYFTENMANYGRHRYFAYGYSESFIEEKDPMASLYWDYSEYGNSQLFFSWMDFTYPTLDNNGDGVITMDERGLLDYLVYMSKEWTGDDIDDNPYTVGSVFNSWVKEKTGYETFDQLRQEFARQVMEGEWTFNGFAEYPDNYLTEDIEGLPNPEYPVS